MWLKKIFKRNKKPRRYSKFIVLLVITLNTWFANKTLNVYIVKGDEPVTLIVAWFAFTTGELWLLSQIKKDDDKEEEDKVDDKLEAETIK